MLHPWQQSQWQQITQQIAKQRLPHALFLYGNKGLGKVDFARSLAASVLCQQPVADYQAHDYQACGQCASCQLLAAGTHPDLHYLKPVPAEKTKSKKPALNIRIDDIRDLCSKLNQTSQFSGYRVAILEQADQLTISAANSLLKTLEEPGSGVLIILTSARLHRLPVTIRSRCQMLRFTLPVEEQGLAWLQKNLPADYASASTQQLKLAPKYSYGSPLAALQNLQVAEQQQTLADAMMAKMSGKNSLDYALKLAKYDKLQILEGMLSWIYDLTRLATCGPDTNIFNDPHRSQLQALANKANPQRLFHFHEQLNFNVQHASIALNEQLLWENLLLSWENL